VPPADLGSPALEAAGPTASGGFFPTFGASAAGTTAGFALSRTTSQALSVLYGSVSTSTPNVVKLAASGTSSGGFFPSGVNGAITTI
jgi:hypothetical protein